MKKMLILCMLMLFTAVGSTYAQQRDTSKTYEIVKQDGTVLIGKIVSEDAREILLRTAKIGDIYVPKHAIEEIREVKEEDIGYDGTVLHDEAFATRYFFTTSALPVEKGEHYIQWNIWGPDFQFGVGDRFGVGIMTSWIGTPLVFNAKYSIPLTEDEKTNLAFGSLLGTASYIDPSYYLALPYTGITFGDRKANLSLLGGALIVGGDGENFTNPLIGIGGMTKLSDKITLMFESIIVLPSDGLDGVSTLVLPGLRFETRPGRAFQFGFAGLGFDGDFIPLPIPAIQFYQKI